MIVDIVTRKDAKATKNIVLIRDLYGYNRIDYRYSPDGKLYFLEANPNPDIAKSEEFAAASADAGMPFPKLIQRILDLGLKRAGK